MDRNGSPITHFHLYTGGGGARVKGKEISKAGYVLLMTVHVDLEGGAPAKMVVAYVW